MAEILTESFCERCGARYTFETTAPRRRGLGRISTLSRGVKNFVANDDASFTEAMAAAREDDARKASLQQLDAFHKAFTFCMSCRQYTCRSCWNMAVGECLSCAPNLNLEVLPAAFPNATLAGPASLPATPATPEGPNVAASAWPVSDRRAAPPAAISGPSQAEISGLLPAAVSGPPPAAISGPPQAAISIPPTAEIAGLLPAEISGPPPAAMDSTEISGIEAELTPAELTAIQEVLAHQAARPAKPALPSPATSDEPVGPAATAIPPGPVDAVTVDAAQVHAAQVESIPDVSIPGGVPDVVARPRAETRRFLGRFRPRPHRALPVQAASASADTSDASAAPQLPVAAAGEAAGPAGTDEPAAMALGSAATTALVEQLETALELTVHEAESPERVGEAFETIAAEAPGPVVAEALVADVPEPVVAELVGPEPEPEHVASETPEPVVAEPTRAAEKPQLVAAEPEAVAAEHEPEPVAAELERVTAMPEPELVVAEPELAAEPELELVPAEAPELVEAEPFKPVAAEGPELVAAEPETLVADVPEPVVAELVGPEPEPEHVVSEVPAPIVTEPELAAEEPELAAAEPELELEPVAAEAPEPVVAEPELAAEPELEPVAAEAAEPEPAEPEPAPPKIDVVVQPEWRMVAPDGSVDEPQPGPPAWATPVPVTRRAEDMPSASWAARVATARPVESPIWAASSRNVLAPTPPGAASTVGVQSCVSCGLSLSASARFCRRCGTRQG